MYLFEYMTDLYHYNLVKTPSIKWWWRSWSIYSYPMNNVTWYAALHRTLKLCNTCNLALFQKYIWYTIVWVYRQQLTNHLWHMQFWWCFEIINNDLEFSVQLLSILNKTLQPNKRCISVNIYHVVTLKYSTRIFHSEELLTVHHT